MAISKKAHMEAFNIRPIKKSSYQNNPRDMLPWLY